MLKSIKSLALLVLLSSAVAAQDSYWLHKGFNDTQFQVNSGDFNEAHSEQAHDKTNKMIKGLQGNKTTKETEIRYKGRQVNQGLPPLKVSNAKSQQKNVPIDSAHR